jgi:hypothetical protein
MSQKDFGNAMALLQAERMKAQIAAAPGQVGSITNQATGEVFTEYRHPKDGARLIDPKIIQSKDGTRAIWNGTNSVIVRDKDSGKVVQGYAAMEDGDGGGGGLFGQDGQTNTPAPVDINSLTNAVDIRAALQSGKIDRDTARSLMFKVQ